MELGQYGWGKKARIFQQQTVFHLEAPPPMAAYGVLNIGNAPFDGLSSGTFGGSAAGTLLAINVSSGYSGNLADWQVAGASKFRVDASGNITNAAWTGALVGTTYGGTGLNTSGVTDGQLLIGQTSGNTFGLATLTQGSNITITNAGHSITIAAAGSVSSVAMTVPSPLTVSGTPVTSAGTLAVTWASGQTANQVLATPDGSTGAVGLRALLANDIPNLSAAKITSGTLATARGGTGVDASAAANGALLIGNSSGLALATLTQGSGITITNGAGTITIAATAAASTDDLALEWMQVA